MKTLGKQVQVLEGRQPDGWATGRWWDGMGVNDSVNDRRWPVSGLQPGCATSEVVRIDGVA